MKILNVTSVLYIIRSGCLLQLVSKEIQQPANTDDTILTSALNFEPYYSHQNRHNLLISHYLGPSENYETIFNKTFLGFYFPLKLVYTNLHYKTP